MEATTAKAAPAAPAVPAVPEQYNNPPIPRWFVRLHWEQFAVGKGGGKQRRGPNQYFLELSKYWKVCDASRVMQENLDEMKTEAWLIVVLKT